MLAVHDIAAGYGPKQVLHDVSLKLEAGGFLGLLGPNGSGKSTLLRVIAGVLDPWAGRVALDGTDLTRLNPRSRARIMACLTQDLGMDLLFTVREVALMGRYPHTSRIGRGPDDDDPVVRRAMIDADVLHLADRRLGELSGGERQRAFFAMCLAQQPRLLLLDEPTSHLDIAHQLAMLDLIRRLNRDGGLTVIAVFHDLNLASEYCDSLHVLAGGRTQSAGPPETVVTAEMIRRVYGADLLVQPNPRTGRPHVVVSAPPT